MNATTKPAPEMQITDVEQRHNAWCRERGWTNQADMRRLFSAGSDAEYAAALRIGDERANSKSRDATADEEASGAVVGADGFVRAENGRFYRP